MGTAEVIEFEVSGDWIQVVHMLPRYTHNIINLDNTVYLVTAMWVNEIFDSNHPDTFGESACPPCVFSLIPMKHKSFCGRITQWCQAP